MSLRVFQGRLICITVLLLLGLAVFIPLHPRAQGMSSVRTPSQGTGRAWDTQTTSLPTPLPGTISSHGTSPYVGPSHHDPTVPHPLNPPALPKGDPTTTVTTQQICSSNGTTATSDGTSANGDLMLTVGLLTSGLSLRQLIASALGSILSPVVSSGCDAFSGILAWAQSQSFITGTGGGITYDQPTVQKFWGVSLGIALAALALVFLLGGLQVMAGASIASVLPRIVLTAVALSAAYPILSRIIDLESAMSQAIVGTAFQSTPGEQLNVFAVFGGGVGTFDLGNSINWAAGVFILIMCIAVCLQMLVRIGLLDVLLVISPLALLCYALPSWQRWANLWISAFIATLFVQFIQMIAIGLGSDLITTLGGPTPVALLVGIAILFLVLKIPGWLGSAVTSTLAGVPSPYALAVGAAQAVGSAALQVIQTGASFGMIEV